MPASGVTAAVVNVTVVGPTASSYVTVFPEGTTQPVVSNLNFTAGETLANLATVPVGSQGGITVYNFNGSVNVVVDVEGYYTTAMQTSGLYNPVNPVRVLGSLAVGASIGPGISTAVTVAGVDGVPADASAVVANVTAAGSSAPGFLTVFPAPASGAPAPPTASNVNFVTGQVIANRVIIPVGRTADRGLQQQRLRERRCRPERLLHRICRRAGQCVYPDESGPGHGYASGFERHPGLAERQ